MGMELGKEMYMELEKAGDWDVDGDVDGNGDGDGDGGGRGEGDGDGNGNGDGDGDGERTKKSSKCVTVITFMLKRASRRATESILEIRRPNAAHRSHL